MATITSGDTLSLYNLGQATGQGVTNVSLGTIKGTPTGGDNIGLSTFGIDTVGTISGFTYAVEDTTETYTLGFSGAGTFFDSTIGSTSSNFTWSVPVGSFISLNTNSGASATFNIASMNPQSPSAQTVLQSIQTHTVRVNFSDGFNDHIGSGDGYGVNKDKTVYSVDAYDGNATALCLTTNTPITLADGTTIEIGDVEEGMELKGFSISGLGQQEGDYLNWNSENLSVTETNVTVKNVVFSFAKKFYSLNNGELTATAEHPFLVKDNIDGKYKFKQISLIEVGDKLIKFENGNVSELDITSIDLTTGIDEIVTIDVENEDTYLANGYITHNKGGNTHTDLPAPGAPTSLQVVGGLVSWVAPASTGTTGITAYDFQIDNNSDFSSPQINEVEYSDTSYSTVGVLSSGTWYVRVRAIDHGLKGTWTSGVSFVV